MKMKYKLTEDYLSYTKDQDFFVWHSHTYGILNEDQELLGEECIALSVVEGKNPFVVIPLSKLETI